MKYAKVILFLIVVIACLAFFHFSGYLDLLYLQQHSRYLLSKVHAHYGVSSLIYILTFLGAVFIGLPITMPLCFLGGYLFGFWHGIIYSLIGIMMASIAYFLIMRIIISKTNTTINGNKSILDSTNTHDNNNPTLTPQTTDSIHNTDLTKNTGPTNSTPNTGINKDATSSDYINTSKYSKYLQQFKNSMHRYGIWYLLFLHFIHIVPYIVINTLAVFANVSLAVFAISTFIGAIPAVFIYSYTGQQITTLSSLSDIWQPNIIFLFLLLIGFALLPMLLGKQPLNSR